MKLLIAYCVIALFGSFSVLSKENQQTLTLVTVENVPIISQLYHKVSLAYRKLNYSLELLEMPSKRALVAANNNNAIDGDLIRAIAAENVLLDYIRIPVPLYYAEIKAYIANSDIKVKSWYSLAEYKVATVRGILVTNVTLKDKKLFFKVLSSPQQALDMVVKNRLDVAVLIAEAVEHEANINFLEENFPYTVVIDKQPFFHYIHKRHKAIIPDLTKALEDVFSDVESGI